MTSSSKFQTAESELYKRISQSNLGAVSQRFDGNRHGNRCCSHSQGHKQEPLGISTQKKHVSR